MARIDNLNNFLTDVAGAIKNKTGVNSITPADFDTAINNISTGIEIDGLLKQYYVAAGQNITPGSFVEFVNGLGGINQVTSPEEKPGQENFFEAYELSDNRAIIFYGTMGARVVKFDPTNGTVTYGTAVGLASVSANKAWCIRRVNDTTFFCAAGWSGNKSFNVGFAKVSGLTITYTSQQLMKSSSHYPARYTCDAVILSDTQLLLYYNTAAEEPGLCAALYTMDSSYSSITLVKSATVTTSYAGEDGAIGRISETQAYGWGSNFDEERRRCTLTFSDSTISFGSWVSESTAEYSARDPRTRDISKYKFFYMPGNNSNSFNLQVVDGGTIGSSVNINSTAQDTNDIYQIDENNYLCAYTENSDCMLCHLTVDGTVITKGTVYNVSATTGIATSAMITSVGNTNDNYFCVGYGTVIRFFKFVNGVPFFNVPQQFFETQATPLTTLANFQGVAKTGGQGGDATGHKDIIEIYVPNLSSAE